MKKQYGAYMDKIFKGCIFRRVYVYEFCIDTKKPLLNVSISTGIFWGSIKLLWIPTLKQVCYIHMTGYVVILIIM